MNFDEQASDYDARVGLPAAAVPAVVKAVVALLPPSSAPTLLEIGAGTGQLGAALARPPVHYIGLDRSAAMLGRFRERWTAVGSSPLLLQADADEPWPLESRSVDLVFSCRAMHLLDPDHVAAEVFRVARSDEAVLVVGRVRRDPESVPARMRRAMRDRLVEEGLRGRGGTGAGQRLLDCCCGRGGRVLASQSVCGWTARSTPADSLRAWAGKPGLAGLDLSATTKARVLARVRQWALAEYGSLDEASDAREEFDLQAVRLSID